MKRNFSGQHVILTVVLTLALVWAGCVRRSSSPPQPTVEKNTLSRTEFTNRIENFFEYEPLKAGQKSKFHIHLTDLNHGSPVEQAEVRLVVRAKGQPAEITDTIARKGKVAGIYLAELTIPRLGQYDVEFQIKNETLEERLLLTDFIVE